MASRSALASVPTAVAACASSCGATLAAAAAPLLVASDPFAAFDRRELRRVDPARCSLTTAASPSEQTATEQSRSVLSEHPHSHPPAAPAARVSSAAFVSSPLVAHIQSRFAVAPASTAVRPGSAGSRHLLAVRPGCSGYHHILSSDVARSLLRQISLTSSWPPQRRFSGCRAAGSTASIFSGSTAELDPGSTASSDRKDAGEEGGAAVSGGGGLSDREVLSLATDDLAQSHESDDDYSEAREDGASDDSDVDASAQESSDVARSSDGGGSADARAMGAGGQAEADAAAQQAAGLATLAELYEAQEKLARSARFRESVALFRAWMRKDKSAGAGGGATEAGGAPAPAAGPEAAGEAGAAAEKAERPEWWNHEFEAQLRKEREEQLPLMTWQLYLHALMHVGAPVQAVQGVVRAMREMRGQGVQACEETFHVLLRTALARRDANAVLLFLTQCVGPSGCRGAAAPAVPSMPRRTPPATPSPPSLPTAPAPPSLPPLLRCPTPPPARIPHLLSSHAPPIPPLPPIPPTSPLLFRSPPTPGGRMGAARVAPKAGSYSEAIVLCAKERRMQAALQLVADMRRARMVPSPRAVSELLATCLHTRRSRDAITVLEIVKAHKIQVEGRAMEHALMTAVDAEDYDCATLALQQLMQEQGGHVHDGLMLHVANMAARLGDVNLIEHVWERLVRLPNPPSPAFHLARIHAYSTAPKFSAAFRAALHLQDFLLHPTLARPKDRPPYDIFPKFRPGAPGAPQDDLFRYTLPLPAPPGAAGAGGEGEGLAGGEGGVTSAGAPLEELNPFTSLRPLTLALCSSVDVLDKGYSTLESMHGQGEVVALAALNCVVAGCAMQRDVGRAQLTFDEITRTFQLQPDTHSFNALMDCYSGVADVRTVVQLFEHMTRTLHLPPSADSFTILVDAHIRAFDAPGACIAMDKMVEAGFTPSRPLLLRLRRRCLCSGLVEGVARAEGLLQALRFRTVNADERRRRQHLAQLPPSVADPRLAARMQGGGQRWEQRGEGQRWGRRRWGEQKGEEQQRGQHGEQQQQQWQQERQQEGKDAVGSFHRSTEVCAAGSSRSPTMSARGAVSRSLHQLAGPLSSAIRAAPLRSSPSLPPMPLPRSLPRQPPSHPQSSQSFFALPHGLTGIPKGCNIAASNIATWQAAPGGLAAGIRQQIRTLTLTCLRGRAVANPRLPLGPLLPRGSGSLAAPALWKGLSLGVQCAAVASLLPSKASACTDAPQTPPPLRDSNDGDDDVSLLALLRVLVAQIWPLLVLLASLFALQDEPSMAAANLAVLCWGLRPDEHSLHGWLEQKRNEDLKDKNGLDWATSHVMGAVVKVEYTDCWFFSLAKVSSITSSYTVLGIFNNWFTVSTTKQSLQFPGLRDRDSD
ncbi:unnamed protein product [Closterium sp. Naga37s-1]|nr:unnamed protein product [Closterium sp. Naga37s-1]